MTIRFLTSLVLVLVIACRSDEPNGPGIGLDSGSVTTDTGTTDVLEDVEADAGTFDAGNDAGAGCYAGTEDEPIGGTCGCQMDCAPGTLCVPETEAGGPFGVCTLACTDDGGECGAEAACNLAVGTSEGICYQPCLEHRECREGWACFYGECNGHCTDDSQCASGSCNTYQNNCIAPPVGEGGILDACMLQTDCRSSACIPSVGCVTFCVPGSDTCPDGAACIGGIDREDPERVGLCMPRCVESTDCPSHLECLNASGERVCFRGA